VAPPPVRTGTAPGTSISDDWADPGTALDEIDRFIGGLAVALS
jgi:hypothetical protein